MTTARPILLLDVDGVLNPLASHSKDMPNDWTFFSFWEDGVNVELSNEMCDAIIALNCDIRWLTSWQETANPGIGANVKWPSFPVVPTDRTKKFWKLNAVRVILAEPGVPVVWIDDGIPGEIDHEDEGLLSLDPHRRLLLIAPDPWHGLRKWHISHIREELQLKGF